jgi:uncharacterized Zn finger protein (UPF0148 family)
MTNCDKCGNQFRKNAKFCRNCGCKVRDNTEINQNNNQTSDNISRNTEEIPDKSNHQHLIDTMMNDNHIKKDNLSPYRWEGGNSAAELWRLWLPSRPGRFTRQGKCHQ